MPMWINLGLSVAFLVHVPFFGNIDMKRAFHSRRAHPTVADSLPPPWRPYPSLALENRFVRGELPDLTPPGPSLRMNSDPRTLSVDVDADSGTVAVQPKVGDVNLGAGAAWPMSRYG